MMGLFSGLFIFSVALAVFTGLYLLIAIPFAALLFFAGWQYRNAVFFLLLIALPFSFEYQFSTGLGTDVPDELLMIMVSVIFVAYWLYKPSTIGKAIPGHPLLIMLGALLCWMMVTVLLSTDRSLSLKYLLAKGWYLGAFVLAPLVVFNNKQQLIRSIRLLCGSMLLVVLVVLLRHWELGFSFATINDAAFPFFRNHVNYSAMLVCILPVVAGAFAWTRSKNARTWIGIAIAIMLVALFFSYARGAWIALLTGAIAWWLIRKKALVYVYLLSIVVTIGLLSWLIKDDRYLQFAGDQNTTIFHKDFDEHLVSTYQLKDLSTAERFYRWIAGVRMIKDKPLAGYGPNTFYEHYKEYAIPAYKTWVSDNPERSTVHNYFLFTAIEQGIPGLIFLLLLFGALLYYAQRVYHRASDPFYKMTAMVCGIMIVMIATLNFFSDLIETDKIGSLFFLCIGTLVIADTKSR
jgi:O-antigen ligase